MTGRLTDEELSELARRFPTHLGEPAVSVLVQRAITEIRERRAADLRVGHMQRVGAIADALPVDPEAERIIDAAMARASSGKGRKMIPGLTDQEREAVIYLRFFADELHNQDGMEREHYALADVALSVLTRLLGEGK